ncbi:hypothetical protein BDW68DRAFT_190820 [Aspergillus falconensis]
MRLFLPPFLANNLNIPPTMHQIDGLSALISADLTICLDELYLSTHAKQEVQVQEQGQERKDEPAVCPFWPNLQRLALYNVAIDSSQFIEGLSRCPNLTHLVLVRPDGLSGNVSPEQRYPGFLSSLQRFAILNTRLGFLHTSQITNEGDSVTSYLAPRMPLGRDDDEVSICQERFLNKRAVVHCAMAPESFLDLAYGQSDTVRWGSKPPNLWTCDVCSAIFQRVDHFKRHSATHETDKRFSCDFCGCVYKRGSKRSCSGGQPCSECHSRGRICSYDRLRDAITTTATEGSATWRFPRVEGSTVSHDMGQLTDYAALDCRSASESAGGTWTLGPQNFYASADVCYKAYSRLS